MTENQTKILDTEENELFVEINYPGVLVRIKAAIIDSLVIIAIMAVLTTLFSKFEYVPDNLRIAGFIFTFILYDPLCTSILGGTIGHIIMGSSSKKEFQYRKKYIIPSGYYQIHY